MDIDVRLDGAPELESRLAHAQAGILDLSSDLSAQLEHTTPTMRVSDSVRMHARPWGAGDVWTLPVGGWVIGTIRLPDNLDALQAHVQDILDGH